MKRIVEKADSIEKLAIKICRHGWYDYPDNDREHPVPRKAIEQYLTMGANWQKQQMMKGLCFETKVYLEDDGCAEDFNYMEWLALENTEITDVPFDTLGLKAGDKVKVIIVKED